MLSWQDESGWMPMAEDDQVARDIGRRLAEGCVREREAAAAEHGLVALGGPPRGILVAEGDSWFDYPGGDILSALVDRHGWDVRSAAHRGDNLESMAYDASQLDGLLRLFEILDRREERPAAVLLSGGGNDLAGPELSMALEHVASGAPLVNDTVLRELVDKRLRHALVSLVEAVQTLALARFGSRLPIVMHGYGYPVPDGRGFSVLGGWGPIPGPWLEPSFARKGEGSLDKRKVAMREIVGRFDAMLLEVADDPAMADFHVVDVTAVLSSGDDYRTWWANELHPTPRGFHAVTDRIAAAIDLAIGG